MNLLPPLTDAQPLVLLGRLRTAYGNVTQSTLEKAVVQILPKQSRVVKG